MGLVRKDAPLAVAVAAGASVTVVVTFFPFAHFAYDNPGLHLGLETAEGVIAGLLAYLAVKRYRTTGQLQDVILAWVFSVLAFVNLVLSAGPLLTEQNRPGGWLTWATLGFRSIASAALCAGAYAGRRAAPPPRRLRPGVVSGTLAALVVVGLAASAADAWLAQPVDPLLSPEDRSRPWAVGHPLVLAIQVLAFGFYTAAAISFTRQGRERGDELLRWLGAGAALGAFARLNYFLFPSLYSNFVYSGDLLRLGSYLFFLIGAARQIDAYWRDQTRLAAVDERRRLARELHDGLAQELAFIRSQAAAMAEGTNLPGMVQHLAEAADRALAESRRAVEALSGAADAADAEPLADALARAVEEVARRAGATVEVEADGSPAVPPAVRDALVRVTREAATNAVRHGGAMTISLRLSEADGRLCLTILDDGTGFELAAVRRGYGLRSMRDRVEALGGGLRIQSAPGEGAVVEAKVPTRSSLG